MPGYDRVELTAELTVVPSSEAKSSPPREQVEAAIRTAGDSGLAREAGPEVTVLIGGRREVLEATMKVVEAALDAGAHAVKVRVEAQGEAERFGRGS
jgi:uncharacterized protein YqgV (UPF0045/DUF77 family)